MMAKQLKHEDKEGQVARREQLIREAERQAVVKSEKQELVKKFDQELRPFVTDLHRGEWLSVCVACVQHKPASTS